jgi:hypothetical protein
MIPIKEGQMADKTITVNLRNFPASLHATIKKQAEKERRTIKAVIIIAVEEYLTRQEGKGA